MKNLRDIFRRLPLDGTVRDALRSFNLHPAVDGKARSVKALAEKLGFFVEQVEMPEGTTGRLVKDAFSPNGYCIEVNRRHSVQARRWAVLHEIGHFLLHADHNDPFAADMAFDASGFEFYLEEDLVKEREANEFAEVLLFGDGALEAAYGFYCGNLERICHHFGVSERVLRIALRKYIRSGMR
ncbi:ImmA/IrrE family metallo-endopeptidase [Maritimibacter dapengensis]|uniref:ImmA/IrrE family metallo-endopeptidase n=1 Tax=Maritimibacter dapengensis TaxID=2836868 RepID=A0ABS6T292_9RHOB|nr:ImmA/IrrE family metallo-endopeptidase [Maritimibacter dapengensis]MBV7379369.1 ImmA/IrrE family metallo-endopeptidase [Maritimibacter dapengensis]